jgi:hypothetical protein
MRSELLVAVALALTGCTHHEKPEDHPPPPAQPAGPPPGDAAHIGTETTTFTPGSQRALIYTWSGRFPLKVQGDVEWLIDSSLYQKTKDGANAWRLIYYTKDGHEALQVGACEYVSPDAAKESYEKVLANVPSPTPLAVEGCDDGAQGAFGDHALALARSSRYLFIFDRPRAKVVGDPAVKTIVKACLTEPPSDDQPPADGESAPKTKGD